MDTIKDRSTCLKCGKTMDVNNFYKRRSGGPHELCKKCLTMHLNHRDPETFMWVLKELDLPYIEEEWASVIQKVCATVEPAKINGMSVLGKYVSKMKLVQFKKYGWEDTQRLMDENADKKQEAKDKIDDYLIDLEEKYKNGEISETHYRTLKDSTLKKIKPTMDDVGGYTSGKEMEMYNEAQFMKEEDMVDIAEGLTDEDKLYLAMKWGRLYKPSEWVELEKKFNEMMESFDIQDSDSISALILICKSYLKMNQSLDCGDTDTYLKLSRVYDTLRKSAKFTAAQNKDEKNGYVDSVGELVSLCEKEGFIPRYCTDLDQDKVDATLKDMNQYVYKLVTQDLGFGTQIENALKKIQIQKEMEADESDIEDGEENFLEDVDIQDYYEDFHDQIRKDQDIYSDDGKN